MKSKKININSGGSDKRMGRTNRIACISLHTVAAEFLKNGFFLYFPSSGATPVDFIAQKDEELFRVEIKTSNFLGSRTSYAVKLSNSHCNTKEKILSECNNKNWDVLVVDLPKSNSICYFLPDEIQNKHSLHIAKQRSHRWGGKNPQKVIEDYIDINRIIGSKKKGA